MPKRFRPVSVGSDKSSYSEDEHDRKAAVTGTQKQALIIANCNNRRWHVVLPTIFEIDSSNNFKENLRY